MKNTLEANPKLEIFFDALRKKIEEFTGEPATVDMAARIIEAWVNNSDGDVSVTECVAQELTKILKERLATAN